MINVSSRLAADVQEHQWATISFVPDDLAWFDWIVRQLEGYPVPSALAGAATRHGFPLPAKLSLFPDRWNPLNFEGYPDALESSRFLIVIVSPNSANATWITDQIHDFKRSGGEERILAIIVDGKPDAPNPPNEGEWLPKWLAYRLTRSGFKPADSTEPVVIDARGTGPGLEMARETLLASLLTTTCHELERIGGLTPPLDLTRFGNTRAEEAPKPEPVLVEKAPALARPRFSPVLIGSISAACAVLFVVGMVAGRMTNSATAASTPAVPQTPVIEQPVAVAPEVQPPAPVVVEVPSAPVEIAPPPVAIVAAPVAPALPPPPTPEEIAAAAKAARDIALGEQSAREQQILHTEWMSQIAAGDAAIKNGKMLQAVDFYQAAIGTAERYAMRRGDDSTVIADMALLCRKLGAMQVQVASVAEARASYDRGRKLLLRLKGKGQLTASREQCLIDLENGFKTLPRD